MHGKIRLEESSSRGNSLKSSLMLLPTFESKGWVLAVTMVYLHLQIYSAFLAWSVCALRAIASAQKVTELGIQEYHMSNQNTGWKFQFLHTTALSVCQV